MTLTMLQFGLLLAGLTVLLLVLLYKTYAQWRAETASRSRPGGADPSKRENVAAEPAPAVALSNFGKRKAISSDAKPRGFGARLAKPTTA